MRYKIFIATLMATCLLGGCTKTEPPTTNPNQTTAQSTTENKETAENTDFPGTYTVPEGWVKSEYYSSPDKVFYIEAGDETDGKPDTVPDNISVNFGKNKYSQDEHEAFREAILKQLLMQLQGTKAQLDGAGTFTPEGYPLYIFTITEEESGIVTEQYYVVGDHQFCLIHATNFTQSETIHEAVQQMADSFVWH